MAGEHNGTNLEYAWRQQRIWSLTADTLKKRIDRGRNTALVLGVIAAGLAVIAVQIGVDAAAGRWVALTSGLAAAMVPFSQFGVAPERVVFGRVPVLSLRD
jgi:hypothetical protein